MGACQSGPKADLYDSIVAGDARAAATVLCAQPKYASKRSMPQRRTVWHVAAEAGQLEVLRAMAEDVRASLPGDGAPAPVGGCTPRRPSVHPIIRDAINSADMGGMTALMLACHKGHADVASFLMDQVGCIPTATPLLLQARGGRGAGGGGR